MSHRLRYIYDFDDVFFEVTKFWAAYRERRGIPVQMGIPVRQHVMGIIRGLLRDQFYLNILPDATLGHLDYQDDVFNLKTEMPKLIQRLHYQIVRPAFIDLGKEWAKVSFTEYDELFIEFDFRPIDFSAYSP